MNIYEGPFSGLPSADWYRRANVMMTDSCDATMPAWEFGRRPVHLLGGSPHAQMEMRHYMNVVSADGIHKQDGDEILSILGSWHSALCH